MPKDIVQKDQAVLRRQAKPVPLAEIGSRKITSVISEMATALSASSDGVAIAAPQIGLSLRIFLVSRKLFDDGQSDAVFINPELIKLSKKKVLMDEGCLSVRSIYGQTKRSLKATVRAYDNDGRQFTWNGSGLMAQIFQHEIDHLNGILFIDHALNLRQDINVSQTKK
jgi:peptide deformylase